MNDEDDDANTLSATKYPCMVSLVALQQMRNRLQLSYLGRKLMKWTAMATGRELRRMAGVLVTTYTPFSESMSNAFLLLARGRYFYPNLNRMVLENVSQAASVKVAITSKAMAGVKLLHYNILESGVEPYEHLGIEKGGQQIHEAKVAWLELLKQVILMLELKIGFMQMETASRNATKRMNVMNKIVIPRTKATIHYILIEMEEVAREELFRIKMIKKKKARDAEPNKKVKKKECPICKKMIELIQSRSESKVCSVCKSRSTEMNEAPNPDNNVVVHKPAPTFELPQKDSVKIIAKPPAKPALKPCTVPPEPVQATTDGNINHLKTLLTEIIVQGKNVVQTGLSNIDIDEFLNICTEAKSKIGTFFKIDDTTRGKTAPNLDDRLNNMKTLLHEVIELTREFKSNFKISSVEKFIATCEQADGKLDVIIKSVKEPPLEKSVSFSAECKNICASAPSDNKKDHDITCEENLKINNLRDRIEDLEKMTTDAELGGTVTKSMETLKSICQDFKGRLDGYKGKVNAPTPPCAKDPSQTMSKNSQMSEIAPSLIGCCENIKKLCENTENTIPGPDVTQEICTHIDCIISLFKQMNDEDMPCKSIDVIMESYESEKEDSYVCQKCQDKQNQPPCMDSCSCNKTSFTKECSKCKSEVTETSVSEAPSPRVKISEPCSVCQSDTTEPEYNDEDVCETCAKMQLTKKVEPVCSICNQSHPEPLPSSVSLCSKCKDGGGGGGKGSSKSGGSGGSSSFAPSSCKSCKDCVKKESMGSCTNCKRCIIQPAKEAAKKIVGPCGSCKECLKPPPEGGKCSTCGKCALPKGKKTEEKEDVNLCKSCKDCLDGSSGECSECKKCGVNMKKSKKKHKRSLQLQPISDICKDSESRPSIENLCDSCKGLQREESSNLCPECSQPRPTEEPSNICPECSQPKPSADSCETPDDSKGTCDVCNEPIPPSPDGSVDSNTCDSCAAGMKKEAKKPSAPAEPSCDTCDPCNRPKGAKLCDTCASKPPLNSCESCKECVEAKARVKKPKASTCDTCNELKELAMSKPASGTCPTCQQSIQEPPPPPGNSCMKECQETQVKADAQAIAVGANPVATAKSPAGSCHNQVCVAPAPPENTNLGLFERKINKIVKVTRTLNDDGTIRVETQTTIITKKKHDPNKTSLDDDDSSDSFDEYEGTHDGGESTVSIHANLVQKTKSEGSVAPAPPASSKSALKKPSASNLKK